MLKNRLRYILTLIVWIGFSVHAQDFGRTPITVDNANELILMATYQHPFPPHVATSLDSRWIAVGRSHPVGGGPGGGGGFPPYQRPAEYFKADVVLVYDLLNLFDEPIVLQGNGRYLKQMVFTESSLLLLAVSGDDEVQTLLEWQIQDETFTGPEIILEDIDTAFAVDTDNSTIFYFYEGNAFSFNRNTGATQQFTASYISSLTQPRTVATAIFFGDEVVAFVDGEWGTIIWQLDRPNDPAERLSVGAGDRSTPIFDDPTLIISDGVSLLRELQVALPHIIVPDFAPILDYDLSPDGDLIVMSVSDGVGNHLTLWDMSVPYEPGLPAVNEPILSFPYHGLADVHFTADGSKLVVVSEFEVALWSVPDNLLTPNGASILSQQNILAYCDNTRDSPITYQQNTRLGIVWSWFAREESLILDHIRYAKYVVRIDNQPLYHWVFVTQIRRDSVNNNDPTVYYYAPIGTALSTRLHEVSYQLSWSRPIRDGYESFGEGTANPTNEEQCFVEIIE